MPERQFPSLKAGMQFHTLEASGVDPDGNEWFKMTNGQRISVTDSQAAVVIATAVLQHNAAHEALQKRDTPLNRLEVELTNNLLPDELSADH